MVVAQLQSGHFRYHRSAVQTHSFAKNEMNILFPVEKKKWLGMSVTRLGNLLDFGQVFKAFGSN